jgi:hypothetical protein
MPYPNVMRHHLAAALGLAAVIVGVSSGTDPTQARDERLAYEIVETVPGTKSQGWHAILHARDGAAIEIEPGKTVQSQIGELTSVARRQNWVPFGLIPTAMLRWMEEGGKGNVILRESWTYRLYAIGEDTRCPTWRGELLRDGATVAPPSDAEAVPTAMGPFIAGPHGFVHTSWKLPTTVRCG